MTEETRQLRAAAIAKADTKIEGLRDEITALEGLIEEIQRKVPPELPDDREWRLSQLSEPERKLIREATTLRSRIAERLFHESLARISEEQDELIRSLEYVEDPQWKVGTQLRIKFPKDFKVEPNPADSKKD
jgi:chromosome segregation ATPase